MLFKNIGDLGCIKEGGLGLWSLLKILLYDLIIVLEFCLLFINY